MRKQNSHFPTIIMKNPLAVCQKIDYLCTRLNNEFNMSSFKGFCYGIATSVTFGLIPLFTLPLMAKGMAFDSILFYRFLFATIALGIMLKVKKEDLATLDPMFKMTVKNVKTFVSAPMTQDTFDKIFGEGNVKSEEEFDAKVAERLQSEYTQESEFRFTKDAKEYLVKKAAVALPEKFLKRWIFVANDGKFTMEEIEKDFDLFLEDFRWNMVRGYLMDKYQVKVEEADLLASAKAFAAYQFAMYGIGNVPEDQLETYAKSILSQEKEGRRVLEQVEDQKTLEAVRGVVTLDAKTVSVEEFRELK